MMDAATIRAAFSELPTLLRGEAEPICRWTEQRSARRVLFYTGVIIAGTGVFGAAMGAWRSPVQAVYTAIKFPGIILLTTFGNALLNAMLAPLLGVELTWRQTVLAILMSFTIAAAILGAFSPVTFFLTWNMPPMTRDSAAARMAFSFLQVTQVSAIAFAGVAAHLRLMQLLRRMGGSAVAARKVLFAWLAGNLLLGSQLGWILRPFFGAPFLPVEFLRSNAFEGNFFETMLRAWRQILSG